MAYSPKPTMYAEFLSICPGWYRSTNNYCHCCISIPWFSVLIDNHLNHNNRDLSRNEWGFSFEKRCGKWLLSSFVLRVTNLRFQIDNSTYFKVAHVSKNKGTVQVKYSVVQKPCAFFFQSFCWQVSRIARW